MKANADSSNLQAKYFCDLLGIQLFHIVENQNDPQRRGYLQDSLMQELMFLAMDCCVFGTACCSE